MHLKKQDLFSTVPKIEHLNLIHELAEVPKFLNLEKEDISKAANISKTSIRYDDRMPGELRQFLSEIAIVCELVAKYFEGDVKKTYLWFTLENPVLGGLSPRDMIRHGRFKKLKAFIQSQQEGNIP